MRWGVATRPISPAVSQHPLVKTLLLVDIVRLSQSRGLEDSDNEFSWNKFQLDCYIVKLFGRIFKMGQYLSWCFQSNDGLSFLILHDKYFSRDSRSIHETFCLLASYLQTSSEKLIYILFVLRLIGRVLQGMGCECLCLCWCRGQCPPRGVWRLHTSIVLNFLTSNTWQWNAMLAEL